MRVLVLLAAGAALAVPALAAKNQPVVTLRFTPTDVVAASTATVAPAMTMDPAEVLIEDGRLLADKRVLGDRSTDDDKLVILTSSEDVLPYLRSTVERLVADWGIKTEAGAALVLRLKLASLQIQERNQAVGATYTARVALVGELVRRDGTALWTGKSAGDATRYGRKYSNDNVNEVQSDALKEAVAGVFSSEDLQSAWAGSPVPSGPGPGRPEPAAPALTPQQMLDELKTMQGAGLSEQTLIGFVRARQLLPALSGADIAAWKSAGISEEVIRAALSRRGEELNDAPPPQDAPPAQH